MSNVETKTVKFEGPPENGICEKINQFEADGWVVKFMVCHKGVSSYTNFALVVFERRRSE